MSNEITTQAIKIAKENAEQEIRQTLRKLLLTLPPTPNSVVRINSAIVLATDSKLPTENFIEVKITI